MNSLSGFYLILIVLTLIWLNTASTSEGNIIVDFNIFEHSSVSTENHFICIEVKTPMDSMKFNETEFRIRRHSEIPADHKIILTGPNGHDVTYCNQQDVHIIYKFIGIPEKTFVSRQKTEKSIPNLAPQTAYIINYSSSQQEGNTQSETKTFTKTTEISISNSVGGSLEVGFKAFSVVDTKVTIDFKSDRTVTETDSEQTAITATPQKVIVKACSKAGVTNHYYETTSINNYLLDYEIDPYNTTLRCKSDKFPFNFNVRVQNQKNVGNPPLEVVLEDFKYILKNVPATEKIKSYDVKTTFSPQESFPKEKCH